MCSMCTRDVYSEYWFALLSVAEHASNTTLDYGESSCLDLSCSCRVHVRSFERERHVGLVVYCPTDCKLVMYCELGRHSVICCEESYTGYR